MVYMRRVARDSYGLRKVFGFPQPEQPQPCPPALDCPPHMIGTGAVPGGLMNLMHQNGASNSEIDGVYRYAHGQPSVYDALDTPSYIPEPLPRRLQLGTLERSSSQRPGYAFDSAPHSMLVRSTGDLSNRPHSDPKSNRQTHQPTTRSNDTQSRQPGNVGLLETIHSRSQPIETSSAPTPVIDLTIVETSEKESYNSSSEPDLEIQHIQTTMHNITETRHVELEDVEQAQLGNHEYPRGRDEAELSEINKDAFEDIGRELRLIKKADSRDRDEDELSEMSVSSFERLGLEIAQETNSILRSLLEYGETHGLQLQGTESQLSGINEEVLAYCGDADENDLTLVNELLTQELYPNNEFLEDLGNRDIDLSRRRLEFFHEDDDQYNYVRITNHVVAGPSSSRIEQPSQGSASFINSRGETRDDQLRRLGLFERSVATDNQKQTTNPSPQQSRKRKCSEFESAAKRVRIAERDTTMGAPRSQETAAPAGNQGDITAVSRASGATADHDENEAMVDVDLTANPVDLFVQLDTKIDRKISSKVVFVVTPKPGAWSSEHDEIVILGHPDYRAEDAKSFHNYPDPGEAAFLVLGQYNLNEFRDVEADKKAEKARKKAEKEKGKGKEKPAPELGHEGRGMSKAQWPLGRISIYEENDWEIPDYAFLGEFDNFQSVATPGCVDEQLLNGIPVSMEEFGTFLPNHYAKFGLSNRLEHNGWEPTRWSDYVSKQRDLKYNFIVKKNTLQNQLKLSRDAYEESKEELKNPVLVRTVDNWNKGDCVRNPKQDMDYYICDLAAGVPRENFPTGPNALLLTRAIECCLDKELYFSKLSEIHQLARKYNLGSKVPPPPRKGENQDRESFKTYEKDLIQWRREKKAEALRDGVKFY